MNHFLWNEPAGKPVKQVEENQVLEEPAAELVKQEENQVLEEPVVEPVKQEENQVLEESAVETEMQEEGNHVLEKQPAVVTGKQVRLKPRDLEQMIVKQDELFDWGQ